MLSYRHHFHVGNHADVLKHIVQSLILEALKQKEKAIFYLDTHAGAGHYAINHPKTQQNAEYRTGIARLWQQQGVPELLIPYWQAIKAMNGSEHLEHYPGSPAIARYLLRPQDRLCLTERHPADFATLQRHFGHDNRVQLVQSDGYQQLKAQLPPPSRRGLILIDPSYEMSSDYRAVVTAIQEGNRRFATGIYAIWYPVVVRQHINQLLRALQNSAPPTILQIELALQPDNLQRGMTASGVLVINPPWKLAQQMAQLLPWLKRTLCTPGTGHSTLRKLGGVGTST